MNTDVEPFFTYMNLGGLYGNSDATTEKFRINSSDGSATFAGPILSNNKATVIAPSVNDPAITVGRLGASGTKFGIFGDGQLRIGSSVEAGTTAII